MSPTAFFLRLSKALSALLLIATYASPAEAQTVDVSAQIQVMRQGTHPSHVTSSDVVVWLTPMQKSGPDLPLRKPQEYTLTQKDKQFTPHILVVPTGSSVNFPNLDPFFHNVFSLFNGKRFDLGLYEGHTRHTVQFDREGVSFIFCNIHPNMGAVVVALSTPYFGVSAPDGTVLLHDVPSGRYRLHVWAENVAIDRLSELSRVIDVSPGNNRLGTLPLQTSGDLINHHQNKFGESYSPAPKQPY